METRICRMNEGRKEGMAREVHVCNAEVRLALREQRVRSREEVRM